MSTVSNAFCICVKCPTFRQETINIEHGRPTGDAAGGCSLKFATMRDLLASCKHHPSVNQHWALGGPRGGAVANSNMYICTCAYMCGIVIKYIYMLNLFLSSFFRVVVLWPVLLRRLSIDVGWSRNFACSRCRVSPDAKVSRFGVVPSAQLHRFCIWTVASQWPPSGLPVVSTVASTVASTEAFHFSQHFYNFGIQKILISARA